MQTTLQKLGVDTDLTFPRIRELRGKYEMTYGDLANAFGAKYHTTAKKRLEAGDFTIGEMVSLTDFFNSKGESETIQSLFFNWIFTSVNNCGL